MNFLNIIADSSLKRLYKYILKKSIGEYLEDELLINQLEVESKCGLVTVYDLKLNTQK